MEESFRSFALGLALTTAVVSANVSADSVSGTASAIVIAPVNVSDTVLAYSASALVSGVTANLIIRLPGTGPSRTDNGYSNSASAALAVVSNDCLQNLRNLASCIKRVDEDGMLKGDPVSNVMLNTVDEPGSAKSGIGITVTYN
jgi:hypothetical protein